VVSTIRYGLDEAERILDTVLLTFMSHSPPKKILIVEDNQDGREGMAILLRMEGFEVVGVADGREALKIAESARPDLIITDIVMPGLDGIDLIKSLRMIPDFTRLPIMVVTAHGKSKAEDAIKAGATGTMIKPVDVKEFLKLIGSLLS
jgi:CheY-like chemotaxis protein